MGEAFGGVVGMLTSEMAVDVLRVLTIIISLTLIMTAAGMVGRVLADMEYQKAAGINGIRSVQSRINRRGQFNRIILGLSFLITSILAIMDLNLLFLAWISRLIFVGVLSSFALTSVLDWYDERKQMQYLVGEEARAQRIAGTRGDGIPERPGRLRPDLRTSESGSFDAGHGGEVAP